MQSYQHFTLEQRECLAEMLKEGKKPAEIARKLGCHRSNVGREIKRNQNKDGTYHPWRATTLYLTRRKKCRRRYRLAEERVLAFIINALNQYMSPAIISQLWRKEHPDSTLSHSTIYRALKRKQIAGYCPKTHLRRRGNRRYSRNTQAIHPVHTIHERPAEVDARERLGDLEGDTVYGGIAKGCLLTLVDRTSRYLYAALSKSRDSKEIVKSFAEALGDYCPTSITLDNGTEFAEHQQIEKNHHTTIYFTDPHSPWQRASNENINDLVRFFFPKGTNFHAVSQDDLDTVLSLINNRPRKCLGWLSPVQFVSCFRCT